MPEGPALQAAPPGTRAWEFSATGTRWRLYHAGGLAEPAALEVAAAIERDEARWSRFRPDSEVTGLNRSAGRWLEVSDETIELLQACADWNGRTGGAFQPLVGRALRSCGYEVSVSEQQPFAQRTPDPVPVRGIIGVDPERGRASIPAGAEIDLGGIGKGWIAARAGALIATLSEDPGLLIDAGGDLLAVSGEHVIAVDQGGDDPDEEPLSVRLQSGQAIATSGFSRRRWVNGDGRASHHLIDPETGAPGPLAHATVVAGDVVTADVTAKWLALRPHAAATCDCAALIRLPGGTLANSGWDSVRVAA